MPSQPSQEYRFIESLRRILPRAQSGRYPTGIGDDAVERICATDERLVFTADVAVENVHFRLDTMSLAEIGRRSMVSNVSDCAAMGARPEAAIVQLVFPGDAARARADMRALYRGFRTACLRYGFEVTGGDLARGPAWVIAITMIGRLEAGGRPLLRSGAKPGDRVWVSGCPGRAAAGLAALKRWPRTEVPRRYRPLTGSHVNPQARPELGALLAANPLVHAAIDISDGVAKEARTIAHMSGARCELRLPGTCPCAPMQALAAELGENWEEWMLYGGEDYELLFTASPAFDPRELPEPTLCIGQIVKGTGACIEHSGRRTPLGAGSWDHFSAR